MTEVAPIFSSRQAKAPSFLAAAVALAGLVNLIQALLPKEPEVLVWMEQFLPFSVSQRSRVLLLGAGLFQLLLSRGLYRRKRAAFLLTLGLLVAIPLLHLGSAFDWHHALAQLVLAAALLHWRGEFQALSDGPSVRWAALISLLLLAALTVFGLVTFHAFSAQIAGERTLWREVQTAGELIFLQGTDTLVPLGPQAEIAFRTVSDAGILFGLVGLILLLRPMLPHRTNHQRQPEKVRALVDQWGVDPLDEFALLADKRHYLARDGRAVVSYALWRDVAVTLGDPVGPPTAVRGAIGEFARYCTRQDWSPVFYEVRPDFLEFYRSAGFRLFKIAEDSRIELPGFALAGRKFQNLRTAHNKVVKLGWKVAWFPGRALPPELHAQLVGISNDWLAARHAIEMTFDLGSMAPESLEPSEVSVLCDEEGKALAFATWLPYAQGRGRSLDLVRSRPTDRGVVDPLVVGCLLEFQQRGVGEVSLGNAPLANIDQRDLDSFEEKAVRLLYERFDQYYGYRTLFDFKNKFHPRWSGRYLAYRGVGNLLPAMAGVARVHLPGGLAKFLRS
ncbi:MAG: bifunctional lysylphosphatidylglycerol flippase/synthetase MprF [Chthoniobacterales bacterium]